MIRLIPRAMLAVAGIVLYAAACGRQPAVGAGRAGDSTATSSTGAPGTAGTGTMGTGTGTTGAATSGTGTTGSSAGGTGTTSPTGAAGTMGDTSHVARDTTQRR